MAISAPPMGGWWRWGVLMSFGRMPALPNSWDLPSVTATREPRPMTVVTRGGHVPGIWAVSRSLLQGRSP